MNLIVDIGNTLIKATFFNNSKIEKKNIHLKKIKLKSFMSF